MAEMLPAETPLTEAVLVVDDDVAILELCARLLTSRGYAVDMAMNAEEALRRAEENPYRVILLDLKLPGMDGMACMRRLKEQGCRAEIVMVTGYGTIPAAVEAMTVGALDFLEKPFNPDLLVAKVQEIIARQDRIAKLSDDPLVAYIQEHATEVNSRRDVATQLGVSLEQVSHRVQSATGQSFRQFLHTCRLDLSKRLLGSSEMNVSQIAKRAGFQTVQHFSRVFRRYVGVSPKQYRLQSRANVSGRS